jgi:protein-L-isoaspartate(D-aspartate) O-methyltransferase
MVEEQLRPGGVSDERVLQVMLSLPRELFVPPEARRLAYDSHALSIGYGQTISQPVVVGSITQALAPGPDDVALEVGTGSGYQAAVLSRLCKRVISVELEPALAERARETLRGLGIDNVRVETGDGSLGWPGDGPYEMIAVSCASPRVPERLVDQLGEGGRLVIPLGSSKDKIQDLRLYRREGDELRWKSLFGVRFVPLRTR